MDKKHFIKALEAIPGNPEIGVNVIQNTGSSEFWAIGKGAIKVLDHGQTCMVFQVRQKRAVPARQTLHLANPVVDSVDCTLDNVFQQLDERYDIDTNGDPHSLSESQIKEICLEAIHKDIAELIRLNDDLLCMFNDKELTKKYTVVRD